VRLVDLLKPECIQVQLEASTKRDAIDALVKLLCDGVGIENRQELADAVWQREMTRTTGIGHGVAIPHGRCQGCEHLSLAVAKPARPLEFGSIDGKPVDLIILLASPPHQTGPHIEALATISRMLGDPDCHGAIRKATTAQEIYDLFAQNQTQFAK